MYFKQISDIKRGIETALEMQDYKQAVKTIVGKYSYGPLCKHWLVERVDAFSSIATSFLFAGNEYGEN